MAEGFVLNIPKEMLDRLQKADENIEKLDKNSRRVGENIRLAFMEGAKGVDKFIGSLNAAQKMLDGFKDRKINVGLNLDAKAIDDLKKQLSTAGVNIPVGVTSGGNTGGGVPNLQSYLDSIVKITENLAKVATNLQGCKVQAAPYTQNQIDTLNKKARTALYREELNALQRLTYAEKEKARVERENDKKNQIAHRQRMVELQQQEREIMRLAKAYSSMPSSLTTQGVNNLLAESKYASTVNQRVQAIKNLKNALKDISKEDANYKKNVASINKEIRRQEQELAKLGHRMNDVSRRSQNLFNISQQLGRALSLMFSVSQIGQYISKMVNVRKEMELQQRSLQVLLQSKDKANELWNQTLDLAVKSPFRVKELVTYTKQLAAYRIESDKLFETNKMLADVSAGLGVDMQRLILAFGQVKSASFLRGTELRQFTEAGIPMLEELSKYFEELYGRSVSVAEVFDMISKRMVTFTDVEAVFQRMTSAGGVFFNMQEELSQTTAGMISNLQDSIDLMFNEIGKKNQGVINTAIKWARGLVDNWETIGMVMKGTLVTLAGYKIATKEWGVAVANVSAQFSKIFTWTNVASVGITAIVALIAKFLIDLHKYNKAIENIVKSHEKLEASVNKLSIDFHRLGVDGVSDIEEYKDKLSELVGIAQQQYNIEVDFVVRNLESIEDVKQKFNSLKEEIISLNNFSMAFDIQFERQTRRGRGKGAGIDTDIENLSNVQKSLVPYFEDMYKILTPMIKKYDELNEVQKRFVDAFAPQKETQTSGEYFEQRLKGLEILRSEYDNFYKEFNKDWSKEVSDFKAVEKIKEIYGIDYNEISKLLGSYRVALGNLKDEQDVLFKTIGDNLSARLAYASKDNPNINKTEFAENFILNAINAEATAKEWSEEVRYEFYKAANEAFGEYEGFNIIPTIEPRKEKGLEAWQIAFNQEVDEIVNSINNDKDKSIFLPLKITTDTTTQQKQLATINDALDEAQKEINRLEIQKANLDTDLRQNKITQEQYDALYTANINKQKQYIEYMTHLRDILGGDDDKGKSKKKNKTLKESINDDISILKSAYDKFQELNENFSSAESFEKVKQAYGKAVGEISGLTIKQSADIGNATEIITESIENYDNALVGFTKAHESFRAEAYDLGDSAITIGYGSTNKMFPDEGIVMGATITKEKAEELLRKTLDDRNDNLKKVIEEKSQELGIEINQSMYNALIDMGYQGAGTEDFYTNFFDRVLNVDKGAAYISNIAEKIGGVFGEDFEHPFTESFIEAFKVSDIEHRIAMMLEASNLTVNGGKISKTLFEGMLKRSQDRRDLAMGSLEYDFTTLEGLKKALESLIPKATSAGEQAMNALLKAISDVDVEIGVRARVKENEKIAKEISDMFSGYEIGLELKDLNMPSNIVKDVFGEYFDNLDIDVSLDEILNKIQQFKTELDNSDIDISSQLNAENVTEESKKILQSELEGNRKRREQLTKDEQKVTEMLNKEYLERLKTYTKYLLNEQHERVKIRMETLRMLQEVEDTKEYTPAQRQTITDKIKEEERKKLAKQTWKDFETSPMYMQLFDDIENMSKGSLEQMIVTMGGLKTELQSMGLPASDLKEILSQINKVEEELERRNPFRNFAENANIAFNRSKELARLEEQRLEQQTIYDSSKEQYDKYQDKLADAQDDLNKTSFDESSIEYQNLSRKVDDLTKETNKWANEVNKAESNLAVTNNQINNINDSSNDFYEQLKNIGSITKSVVDGVFQITDAMSWLPEETQLSLERMKGLSDSAFTIAGGIGSIMSGDVIGGITSLISGVSGLVSLFMEWSSGAKEAAIETEKQGRLLTDLQNKYDRLNKAIDEAWDVAQIKQYNAELQKNLQQQIIAQKAIIEAQKSVKGANDYGSEQWLAVKEAEEELQNLYDTQEESQKNIYSKLTGGIMDDVLSTTESFVDAWYDAFKETGDGLKGLEDSFNEMLLNLVKRQASMKIAGRFIDEWDKALERYASDGDLSNSEIEYYANKVKNDLPALSSQLEAFFSSFDNVLGDASGNLSGLQRGISSITAEQADILASYANSCRFLLASIDTNLSHLASRVMSQMSGENPMVEQLRIIANNTQMLYNLFSGMTAPYSGGGRGLRVVI